MGQQRVFGFEMCFSGLLFQGFEFDLDPFQIFFADMAVMFSLLRVIGDDKLSSACTLCSSRKSMLRYKCCTWMAVQCPDRHLWQPTFPPPVWRQVPGHSWPPWQKSQRSSSNTCLGQK